MTYQSWNNLHFSWDDVAYILERGLHPPLDYLAAAIRREGVPPQYWMFVAERIRDATPAQRPHRGRPKDKWKDAFKLGDFLRFHDAVRARQAELKAQGAPRPFETALGEVGELRNMRMPVETFRSKVRRCRKMGVEIPI